VIIDQKHNLINTAFSCIGIQANETINYKSIFLLLLKLLMLHDTMCYKLTINQDNFCLPPPPQWHATLKNHITFKTSRNKKIYQTASPSQHLFVISMKSVVPQWFLINHTAWHDTAIPSRRILAMNSWWLVSKRHAAAQERWPPLFSGAGKKRKKEKKGHSPYSWM